MSEKSHVEMSDAELAAAMVEWGARVDDAAGWASAYFAAKQCAAIETVAQKRGLSLQNKWPIKTEHA